MNPLIQDGPAQEIQMLRLFKVGCPTVDIGQHILLCQSCLANLIPDGIEPVFGSSIVDDNIVNERSHITCATAAAPIDVVGLIVDRIDALVIVKGQIKVPNRSYSHQILVALFIHIDTPVGIGIARHLSHEEMAEETVEIKIVQPIILHLIEEVLDILLLIGGDLIFVWRLDSNRITLVGSEP